MALRTFPDQPLTPEQAHAQLRGNIHEAIQVQTIVVLYSLKRVKHLQSHSLRHILHCSLEENDALGLN